FSQQGASGFVAVDVVVLKVQRLFGPTYQARRRNAARRSAEGWAVHGSSHSPFAIGTWILMLPSRRQCWVVCIAFGPGRIERRHIDRVQRRVLLHAGDQ